MSAAPSDDDVARFVVHEARLIDDRRFEQWYELFSDDARYWVPAAPHQQDGENHVSLAYEDKLLLRLRIERLKNPRSYSQHPESRCVHVLQNPEVEKAGAGEWKTRSRFIYVETRGPEQQVYAGTASHVIVLVEGSLRIRLKRVDILNCDAPLPSIQLFI
jgi:3-phenylpropionate/cinnamic acid dioxygenase small subunit